LFNRDLGQGEHSVTNSSVRKHIKVLKEYNLIKPINEGGRPEYLELTEEGKAVFKKLR
jgi:DNA-binding MarR family transcriptional regulator